MELQDLLSKCRLCKKDVAPPNYDDVTKLGMYCERCRLCACGHLKRCSSRATTVAGKTLVYLQSKCSRCEKVTVSVVDLSFYLGGTGEAHSIRKQVSGHCSIACHPVSIPFAVYGWAVFISSRLQRGTAIIGVLYTAVLFDFSKSCS